MRDSTASAPRSAATRIRCWAGRAALTIALATLALLGLGPHTGAYQTLTVLTGSMAPTIPAGSVVAVRPVEPSALRVGDVITYRIPVQDRRVVTHRIVAILEPGSAPVIRTKGDAIEEPDPWTTRLRHGPVWRVIVTAPHAGQALRRLQAPLVRNVTLLGGAGLLAASLLAAIWRPASPEPRTPRHPRGWPPPPGVVAIAPGRVWLPDLPTVPAGDSHG